MNYPKNATLLLLVSLILALVYLDPDKSEFGEMPVPTEIIQKKKDRKQFKKDRKEWLENMHRTAPGVDWKKMDQQTHQKKIAQKTEIRKILQTDGLLSHDINTIEITTTIRDVLGQWFERGSNNLAGRIRTADVDFENDQIYCASSGGNIWRGNMDGTAWISLNDYFQITGIHLLKNIGYNGNNRLIMVNGKQCYRSDNEGLIIEDAEGLESFQSWGWIFRGIVKNDTQQSIYLGVVEWDYTIWTYLPSIYKSTDGGESFTRILELTSQNGFTVGTSHFDIWAAPVHGGNVYVLNDGKCYILSPNDDLMFVGEFSPTESGSNILIGGVDNEQVFLHCRIGSQLYSSDDGGNSWQAGGTLPTGTFTINSFECAPNDPNKLVIGNVDGYFSINGGSTWNLINHWWEYYSLPETKLHADLPEFNYFIDPETDEELQLISSDGGLYISYDHFNSVQNISLSGLGVSQYYSTYTARNEPHHVFAGSQDQGFQRHLSDGAYEGILDFEQTISGDYGHIISGDGGTSLWTDYPGFALYYPDIANYDGYSTWDFQGSGYLWLPPLMIDPYQPNVSYVGGGGISSQHHMVKITYSNNNIIAQDMSYTFNDRISAMAWSPVTNHHWYVSTENGKFYYSTTMGQNFTQTSSFTGPESHYFYGSTILPSPADDQRVYIGGSGYSNPAVYLSTDGGETFSSFDEGLPNTLVYELACLPNESIIFAATAIGPYYFSYENGQWEDLAGENAPDQTYWTVDYIPQINTVRFGTYGRGIWDYTFDYNPVMLPGDLNQDDMVNIQDLIMMVQLIMNGSELTDFQWQVGDLNFDEIIDIYDLIHLADILVG